MRLPAHGVSRSFSLCPFHMNIKLPDFCPLDTAKACLLAPYGLDEAALQRTLAEVMLPALTMRICISRRHAAKRGVWRKASLNRAVSASTRASACGQSLES